MLDGNKTHVFFRKQAKIFHLSSGLRPQVRFELDIEKIAYGVHPCIKRSVAEPWLKFDGLRGSRFLSHQISETAGSVYGSPCSLRRPPTSQSDTKTVTEALCAPPRLLGEIIDE